MNNTDNPSVSVVVPVYKVEKYIKECIDSILSQSYQNYELILVDDGSPDCCGQICDDYASRNNQIKVIHKKNGGLSDARNAGIKIASGEYITFIDSDDAISKDYLEKLVSASVKYNADIVQGELTRKALPELATDTKQVKTFDSEEAFKELLTWKSVKVYAWAKLYKLSLFHEIEYPVGRLNEDCCTTYKLVLESKKIVCIDNVIYFYRITPNSILTSKFNMKRFQLWNVPDEIKQYIGLAVERYVNELNYYQMRIGVNLINDSAQLANEPEIKKFQNEIIVWLRRYNKSNPYIDRKYRAMIFALTTFPTIYVRMAKHSRK